jgi:hypothetical protein
MAVTISLTVSDADAARVQAAAAADGGKPVKQWIGGLVAARVREIERITALRQFNTGNQPVGFT